jgi:hypothetical protein
MIHPFHHPKLNGALPVQELPRYLSIYTPTSCFSGCVVLHSFEVSTCPLKHLTKFKGDDEFPGYGAGDVPNLFVYRDGSGK